MNNTYGMQGDMYQDLKSSLNDRTQNKKQIHITYMGGKMKNKAIYHTHSLSSSSAVFYVYKSYFFFIFHLWQFSFIRT